MAQRLVTFTTDFGVSDHFVGTMKGVIANINPSVQIMDISNSINSYDILDGALAISQAFAYFPTDTVHLVLVDPGVGTSRRPLLATTDRHILVAPDNGVLSLIYDKTERVTVRHITAEHYFMQPVSNTFHGRDIFAPVVGWLSKGVEAEKFGEEITDFVRLAAPRPKAITGKQLKGVVLKSDKFGNLITNFSAADFPQLFHHPPPPIKILINGKTITKIMSAYSQAGSGEAFGIWGSMGFLEISVNRGAANGILQADRGTPVELIFEETGGAKGT